VRAHFIRHNENPLDTVEIGRVHERNLIRFKEEKEKIIQIMDSFYKEYGAGAGAKYTSTSRGIKEKEGTKFLEGFWFNGNQLKLEFSIEEDPPYTVNYHRKNEMPKTYPFYQLENAIEKIKAILSRY
jgi:hypothetical protein